MSRAGPAKSKVDKSKPPASQTPVITHEIVPGKFNDHDWNVMLEKDSSEDFVLDILDDVLGNSLGIIHDKYIERQLLPFTISLAKDAILQIIEWQFLARDEGEGMVEHDPGWLEDEEPEPAVTDCWAQGSVPKAIVKRPGTPLKEPLEEIDELKEETEETPEIKEDNVPSEEPELDDKISEPEEPGPKEIEQQEEKKVEQLEPKKKRRKSKFRPYRGTLKSPGISQLTTSLEESEMRMMAHEMGFHEPQEEEKSSALFNMPASCHSILRVQAGRPPGNKDVVYDETGNVIAVVKLNPERLPQHRVKVGYTVVDPSVEAAQSRLEAMRRGKVIGPTQSQQIVQSIRTVPVSEGAASAMPARLHRQQPPMTPLPPPLVEAMDVAPGVIVQEGERTRRGPDRYVRRADLLEENQVGLRPIATRIHIPNIDVSDLLDRHTPIVRPLQDSPPLPPILPHPPAQPKVST